MTTRRRELCFYTEGEMVLNFHDACLYGRDINILQDPKAWLNADCIHFALVSLQQNCSDVLFLDPSVVFCLVHQCEDDNELLDLGRQFQNASMVALPVNDTLASGSQWQTPGLGSHWSLLLMKGDTPYHWDSVSGRNSRAAQNVARKWQRLRKLFHPATITTATHDYCPVVECPTPQQKNGFDCGLHALAAAKVLSTVLSLSTTTALKDMMQKQLGEVFKSNPHYCRDLRKEILRDIESKL